ncbi:hypothetical protein RO3G_08507 [Rhizopus delemar RA 99-880]|uniref:Uncharacterized protein n=1 Tax=Rhizopus delemar (strain RA 99-880 / ATCC MYA-4621 / FGSC 9543 / NRRL 43880) TaxID=246409 RepID=I1C5S2_RHIO9|nr:hypothetical protein RO3G_08507 [Rhizopus delemar RA 99-880]|eukprot:EIE83802.1 hypothetical protein RO3G_08507 [Rhizopus delemar RA 99-880]
MGDDVSESSSKPRKCDSGSSQRNNKAEEIGTKSYSFIQILSFTLMLTTAINLIYVYSVKYYYYYIHGHTIVSHPYT